MKGSGRAKLDFGNCWDGRKPWSHSYVKVYLDGTEIKSARWFSVGICKYKPGYKSHDLL